LSLFTSYVYVDSGPENETADEDNSKGAKVTTESDDEQSDTNSSQAAVDSNEHKSRNAGKHKKSVTKSAVQKRVPWSAADLDLLRKAFRHYKKPPDTESIKTLVKNHPHLQQRTIPQIRSRAWALIRAK
jgi:hypothetical protein